MKSDQIEQITNKAPIAALNAGRSKTLKRHPAVIGRFYRYSLWNVMLISSQNPAANNFVFLKYITSFSKA